MEPLAQLLASALRKPKSVSTKTQILQALDMISGCFCSLVQLGDLPPATTGAAASLSGVNHPTNQFFGVLWPMFKQTLQQYCDDPDVVEKQCRCVLFVVLL